MSKSVLITGCSTGIGRACAEKFAGEDWNVAATMRNTDMGAELAERENVEVYPLDVTDESSIKCCVALTLERFDGIDAIINNAAYSESGPVEFATDEVVERQFSTNVGGPIRVMRAVLPHMRERGAGVIVNITSGAGRIGFPLTSLYCGTKFAIEGITESIQYELQPLGIRVKLVEPGFTDSSFFDNSNTSTDAAIADYDSLAQKVFGAYDGDSRRSFSTPAKIAEVIYQATIDESPRLRYPAGDDVVALMALRDSADDETVFNAVMGFFA